MTEDLTKGDTPQSATTKEEAGLTPPASVPPVFTHPRKKREDFDSDEEHWFYLWLGEAVENKLVKGWNYHTQGFLLSGRKTIKVPAPIKKDLMRKKNIFLLHPQYYTPDFVFGITAEFMDLIGYKAKIYPPSHKLARVIIVDVKGKYAGKNNNSAITFPVLQKWLCDKQDVLVNKLVPEVFFRKTWCPYKVAFSKNGKRYKKWEDFPLYEEWWRGDKPLEK